MKICVYSITVNFYSGSLSNSFLDKPPKYSMFYSIFYFYFSSISLSLSKRFIYLLLLSKYLAYAFIWGRFIHNGDGKEFMYITNKVFKWLFITIWFSWNNTILLIYLFYLFLWKASLMIPFSPKNKAPCSIFYTMKRKKVKITFLSFWLHGNFFDILLVFISFLQTYYDIYFLYILSFHFSLFQINFCIYL